MAKFELNYKQSVEYDERVEIEIKLQKRPTQTEYQDMLDAISTLDKIAQKYVIVPKSTNNKEKK